MVLNLALVLEISTWALLAAIAVGDFSAGRSGGEASRVWVYSKYVLLAVFFIVVFVIMSRGVIIVEFGAQI